MTEGRIPSTEDRAGVSGTRFGGQPSALGLNGG